MSSTIWPLLLVTLQTPVFNGRMASGNGHLNAKTLEKWLTDFFRMKSPDPLVVAHTLRLCKRLVREEPHAIPRTIETLVEPLQGHKLLKKLYLHRPFIHTLHNPEVLRELLNSDPLPPAPLLRELACDQKALPLIMRAYMRTKQLESAAQLLSHISPHWSSNSFLVALRRVAWRRGTPLTYRLKYGQRLWWANHIIEWYEEVMGLGVGNFHIHHGRSPEYTDTYRRLQSALSQVKIRVLSEPEAELYRQYWSGDVHQWSQLEWVEPDQDPADLKVFAEQQRRKITE